MLYFHPSYLKIYRLINRPDFKWKKRNKNKNKWDSRQCIKVCEYRGKKVKNKREKRGKRGKRWGNKDYLVLLVMLYD